MASIVTQNLNDRIKNDTFRSVQFTLTDENSDPIDLTGATIEIEFRFRCKTGSVVKSVSVGSGITVATPANGILVLDAFTPVDWAADTYYYDCEIGFSDGTIQTPVQGMVEILQDTTNT